MLVCKLAHVGVSFVVCLAVVALTLFFASAWSRGMNILALFQTPLQLPLTCECFYTIKGVSSLRCFHDL